VHEEVLAHNSKVVGLSVSTAQVAHNLHAISASAANPSNDASMTK